MYENHSFCARRNRRRNEKGATGYGMFTEAQHVETTTLFMCGNSPGQDAHASLTRLLKLQAI